MIMFALFILLFGGDAAPRASGESLYLELSSASGFYEIDIDTGNRTLHELYDYPHIIELESLAGLGDGTVLCEAGDAAGRRGLWRYDTATGVKTPVSGFVDALSDLPLGTGDEMRVDIHHLAAGRAGDYAAVAYPPARIVGIDRATGNRRLEMQSAEPPVGTGDPIERPIDFELSPDGRTAFVLERFQGLYRVDRANGNRTPYIPNPLFTIIPDEFEMLPNGRVVTLRRDPDLDAVFQWDPQTSTTPLLSGSYGGEERGAGPSFGTIFSLAKDRHGIVYVYDGELPAVFRVDVETGDRTIISGGPENIGTGDPLPGALDEPRLHGPGGWRDGTEGWVVR